MLNWLCRIWWSPIWRKDVHSILEHNVNQFYFNHQSRCRQICACKYSQITAGDTNCNSHCAHLWALWYSKSLYQQNIDLQLNPNPGNRGLFWYWEASGVPLLRLWNRPPWLYGDILWAIKLKWSPWVWLRIFRLPHLGRLIGVLILVLIFSISYRLYREQNP